MKKSADRSFVSEIAVHLGEALRSAAIHYETIAEVAYEEVQNALDAGARTIRVEIDLRRMFMRVADNGRGMSREQMEAALRTIYRSLKSGAALGEKGIGMMAPMGKSDYFTITTTPEGGDEYRVWRFVPEEIFRERDSAKVPAEVLPDLRYNPKTSDNHPTDRRWRTEVMIVGLTSDRSLSRMTIGQVAEVIKGRYGAAMRRHRTTITLRITDKRGRSETTTFNAPDFVGQPLGKWQGSDLRTETVEFRMFWVGRSPKGKHGEHHVYFREQDRDYRLKFEDFLRNLKSYLREDVAACLGSGEFEGEIFYPSSLVLRDDRLGFLKSDALDGLCKIIERWYDEIGQQYLEEARTSSSLREDQRLCRAALSHLRQMFERPEFADCRELVSSFATGSIGGGHSPVAKGRVIGPDIMPSLTDHPGRGQKTADSGNGRAAAARFEHPGLIHLAALGPEGQKRRIVKHGSFSLRICPDQMQWSERRDRMWELVPEQGIMFINNRHPRWADCKAARNSEAVVNRLVSFIAVNALRLHAVRDSAHYPALIEFFDRSLEPYCICLLSGNTPVPKATRTKKAR